MGAERGYGIIDLDRMTIAPGHWRDWRQPFAAPPENLAIEFPNITVLDKSSCSACQSTLLLFLTRYKDQVFDYFPGQSELTIALGKGHTQLPEGNSLHRELHGQSVREGHFRSRLSSCWQPDSVIDF